MMLKEKSLLQALAKEDDTVKKFNSVVWDINFENELHQKRLQDTCEEKIQFAIEFHNSELTRYEIKKQDAERELQQAREELKEQLKKYL